MTTMEYPEHERLREVQRETQAICEFMEWLDRHKAIELRQRLTDYPVMEKMRELVAEFYEIDLKEIENEKDRMVGELRRMNEPTLDPNA